MAKSNPASQSLRKSIRRLPVAGMLALTLAMTMPSCPGQEAMQKQIDSLQGANARLSSQVASLDAQVKSITADSANIKQQIMQIAQTVDAQKGALDQLSNSVKELDQKIALAAARMSPKGRGARARKRRPR